MSKPFECQMTATFIAATVGSVMTDAFTRGLNGAKEPLDLTAASFNGAMTAVDFVAPAIAENFLTKQCKAYQRIQKEGNKAEIYVINAVAAGALITAIKYPIQVVQNKKDGKPFDPIDLASTFAKNSVANFAFPVTATATSQLLGTPKDSVQRWAFGNISNLAGGLGVSVALSAFDLPKLTFSAKEFVKAIPSTVFMNDSFLHGLGVLGYL